MIQLASKHPALMSNCVPVRLRIPTDWHNWALALLALLAFVYALRWASAVFIPLLLGLMCSYALSPVVDLLQRWRIPRAIGAAMLLLAALSSLGSMAYSLSDDASALIDSLPDAAQKLRDSLRTNRGTAEGAMEKVQRAATSLEHAAEDSGSPAPLACRGCDARSDRAATIQRQRALMDRHARAGRLGRPSIGGAVRYLLPARIGDTFRRKMAKVAGPTFGRRKATIRALDEITAQIQRYLLVQTFTSVLVGLATWAAFASIGLAHAAVWGVMAAVLNLVPYLGSIVVSGGAALVGFLQFGALGMALLIGAASLVIHTLSGNLLTPWLTSRASRMNPVAIFVGVLAWGWLWGIWGLLLGAPLLIVIKAACDRVDALHPFGELLGD